MGEDIEETGMDNQRKLYKEGLNMGGKSKGSQTSTATAEPWKQAQPYMIGADGRVGTMPESERLYQIGGWTPGMDALNQNYQTDLNARNWQPWEAFREGKNALMGGYDPTLQTVDKINAQSVTPFQSNASKAGLDQSGAWASLLTGTPNNPWLKQQADSIIADLTRNTNENVMPGIASGAMSAGQYGGSRQGIAEGLAASRLNQDASGALANLYGNAYENAQQRMYGAAGALNSNELASNQQMLDVMAGNANRDMAAQSQNAGNTLQGNTQQMALMSQILGNRQAGLNLLGAGQGMQDATYGKQFGALQAPSAYNWGNLDRYANIVNQSAGMGGTKTGTEPTNRNIGSGALGGALGGAALGSALGLSNPWTAGLAIGGGLLGAF